MIRLLNKTFSPKDIEKNGIHTTVKYLRGYVSGNVLSDYPLTMTSTVANITKTTNFEIEGMMLLHCLKTNDLNESVKFNYFLKNKKCDIKRANMDNVTMDGKKINGGCMVKIKYPNVHIISHYDIEPQPSYVPQNMKWRCLYNEDVVCRCTKRPYLESLKNGILYKPYGWWTDDYVFLSKEEAANQIAPVGVRDSYTIQGKTYTDIKWKVEVTDPNITPVCDVTQCECGEGRYVCNKGNFFISVEAVIMQSTKGTLMKILKAVSALPQTFKLQIFARQGDSIKYVGYKKDNVGIRGPPSNSIISRFKNSGDEGMPHYKFVTRNGIFLEECNVEDSCIDLNLEGEFFADAERGLYMIVVDLNAHSSMEGFGDIQSLRF